MFIYCTYNSTKNGPQRTGASHRCADRPAPGRPLNFCDIEEEIYFDTFGVCEKSSRRGPRAFSYRELQKCVFKVNFAFRTN